MRPVLSGPQFGSGPRLDILTFELPFTADWNVSDSHVFNALQGFLIAVR